MLSKLTHLRRVRIAIVMVGLIISGTILYLVLSGVDLRPVFEIPPSTLIVILGLSVLSKAVYVFPISRLLRDMGYKVRRWPLFLILETSYAGNYLAPAKVGIPLRVALYRQILHVPASSGTACVVISNFFWFVLVLIVAFVGLLGRSTNLNPGSAAAGLVLLVLGMVLVLSMPFERLLVICRRLPGQRFSSRLLGFLIAVQSSLRQVKWTTSVFFFSIAALKLWIQGFTAYLILRDLGGGVSSWQVLWALCISLAVGVITLLPMGIGTQDASFVFLLTSLGVSQELAILLALADRVIFTAIPFLTGVVSANILGISLLSRTTEHVAAVPEKDTLKAVMK